MANPNPVIPPKFKEMQFARSDRTTETLSDKTIALRLPADIDEAV